MFTEKDLEHTGVEVRGELVTSWLTSIARLIKIGVPAVRPETGELTGIDVLVSIDFIDTQTGKPQAVFKDLRSTRDSLFHRHDMAHGVSATPPILKNYSATWAELLVTSFYIALDRFFYKNNKEKLYVCEIAKGDFYTTREDSAETLGCLAEKVREIADFYEDELVNYPELIETILASNYGLDESFQILSLNGRAGEAYGLCMIPDAFRELRTVHDNVIKKGTSNN